ncbi:MAG: fatty acid desaturase family protein [Pseudomonas sp.]|uniref:fatty acid desaturase family protein n=1 Tax=Pseudomonas sp. TaxID=306 RepID=UPI00339ABA4E
MTRRPKLSELFSHAEIRQLTRRSNAMGLWAIGSTWAVIALSFIVLVYARAHLPLWGQGLALLLALLVIAGRQLALAILQHEGAHGTLFASAWGNDILADWLCARPLWNQLHKYRPYHLVHHTKTSSADDPDLSLTTGFPTSRRSLTRKILRDLSGLSGLKFLLGRALMDAEVLKWTVANDVQRLPRAGRRWPDHARALLKNSAGMLLTNALLAGVLWASGHAWLYGVWALAYLTPFPLFVRIRSMAEHACTQPGADPLRNTRTTAAGWLARATVAPVRVNFHIEHHLMASVPYFRLPHLHRLLRERGLTPPPPSYLDVLQIVSGAAR